MTMYAKNLIQENTQSPADSNTNLADLRQLLLGSYVSRQDELEDLLSEVQKRLDSRNEQKSRCAHVLVEAIESLHDENKSLDAVLDPDVKRIVHRIFKNEPEAMAESLYPVLGPAIRRMIASLFEFAPSGKAETYKVEQLLLIHRTSSTVMASAVADDVAVQDADVVSGMLEAIRSFIQDAFDVADYDGVNTLTLGDITVWTIWSPHAVLAVVIRGIPPASLKTYYEQQLREMHQAFESTLENYSGDDTYSTALEDSLCKAMNKQAHLNRASQTTWFGKPAIVLGLICLTMLFIENTVSERREWKSALNLLSQEAGVVVVSSSRGFRQDNLTLLRDPRARSKTEILESTNLNSDNVIVNWSSFHSADPELNISYFGSNP